MPPRVRMGGFRLEGDCGTWRGRTAIIATGVTDIWPSFPGVERYVGRPLFWCITCDGFRTRDRSTLLVGADDAAATTACQFLLYTDRLTFVVADDGIAPDRLDELRRHGIAVV